MKYIKILVTALFFTGAAFSIHSCKKDDTQNPVVVGDLTVSSVKSGVQELNGSANAVGVSVTSDLVVTFSKEIKAASASDFVLTPTGGTAAFLSISVTGNTVMLNPSVNLERETDYTLTMSPAIAAADGGKFAGKTIIFKTEIDNMHLVSAFAGTVNLITPTGVPAENVKLNDSFVFTFDKNVDTATVKSAFTVFSGAAGSTPLPMEFLVSGKVVTLTPVNPFSNKYGFHAIAIANTLKSKEGHPFSEWNGAYNNVDRPDMTLIGAFYGAEPIGETQVLVDGRDEQISLQFNRPLNLASFSTSDIQLIASTGGGAVPANVILAGNNAVLLIQPIADLDSATAYQIQTPVGLASIDGSVMSPVTLRFKTKGTLPPDPAIKALLTGGYRKTWRLDSTSGANPIVVGTETNPTLYYAGGPLANCQVNDWYTFTISDSVLVNTNGDVLRPDLGYACAPQTPFKALYVYGAVSNGFAGLAQISLQANVVLPFIGVMDHSLENVYRILEITSTRMLLRSGDGTGNVHTMKFVPK